MPVHKITTVVHLQNNSDFLHGTDVVVTAVSSFLCSYHTVSLKVNVRSRQQQERKTPDTISVLFINQTGSRWERIGRLREEAMAFNFLKGARPATALQLLFVRWPVIPPGLGLVSSYRCSFKHTASLKRQRHSVPPQYTSTICTSVTQLHINVTIA